MKRGPCHGAGGGTLLKQHNLERKIAIGLSCGSAQLPSAK
uniref:Uncharacterized protein n=1 Tax=Anguilla anguilla TaxID=7936 RepID=A0A0E9RLK7_ANGAN